AYVVILSPDSVASDWVRRELLYSLQNKKGLVYPVLYRDVPIPFEVSDLQYVDFRGDARYQSGLFALKNVLPDPPRTGPQLPKDLEDALKSPRASIRLAAVGELISLDTEEEFDFDSIALDWLGRLSRTDPDPRVRQAAEAYFSRKEVGWLIEEGEISQQEAEQRLRQTVQDIDLAFKAREAIQQEESLREERRQVRRSRRADSDPTTEAGETMLSRATLRERMQQQEQAAGGEPLLERLPPLAAGAASLAAAGITCAAGAGSISFLTEDASFFNLLTFLCTGLIPIFGLVAAVNGLRSNPRWPSVLGIVLNAILLGGLALLLITVGADAFGII
ncbi:MAG: TIR domain-containing protein, partial [Chloroflexi bacterium]|nr:TIR domain-containing protein [Chloroflexota bacterium]